MTIRRKIGDTMMLIGMTEENTQAIVGISRGRNYSRSELKNLILLQGRDSIHLSIQMMKDIIAWAEDEENGIVKDNMNEKPQAT